MPTKIEKDIVTGTDTTGHEWDGVKELNTPLPKWWLYVLYATIAWAAVWCVLYPSWPGFTGYFHGVLGYSQRDAVDAEVRAVAAQRASVMDKIGALSFEQIRADPPLIAAADTAGRIAFANNCQPCHGAGGGGQPAYPALAAGAWIWGGSLDAIQQTITYGIRSGDPKARDQQMPRFGVDGILKPDEIQQVADYVMTLYGHAETGPSVAAGKKLYRRQLRDLSWRSRAGGSRERCTAACITRASLWRQPRHHRRADHQPEDGRDAGVAHQAGSRHDQEPHALRAFTRRWRVTISPSEDNRLNCVGVRSDWVTLGQGSRRQWRWDVRKAFNTEEAARTMEGHGVEYKLRFARSALNTYSVALRGHRCFLRVKSLPGWGTAHVSAVVGTNAGFGHDGRLYGTNRRMNGCDGWQHGCDGRM